MASGRYGEAVMVFWVCQEMCAVCVGKGDCRKDRGIDVLYVWKLVTRPRLKFDARRCTAFTARMTMTACSLRGATPMSVVNCFLIFLRPAWLYRPTCWPAKTASAPTCCAPSPWAWMACRPVPPLRDVMCDGVGCFISWILTAKHY